MGLSERTKLRWDLTSRFLTVADLRHRPDGEGEARRLPERTCGRHGRRYVSELRRNFRLPRQGVAAIIEAKSRLQPYEAGAS